MPASTPSDSLRSGGFLLIPAGAVRGHRVGFVPDGYLLGMDASRFFDIIPAADLRLGRDRGNTRLSGVRFTGAVSTDGAASNSE